MNRVDRAKQFLPFDALKGLQEELESREEKMSRVPRHDLSDELMEELSSVLSLIEKGSIVDMTFYRKGHYYNLRGEVESLNIIYKYLIIGEEKIHFDDIYTLSLVDG